MQANAGVDFKELCQHMKKRKISDFYSSNSKPATHLAILFADRREFIASENRERFTPPTGCGHTWRFFSPIAATWHFNLVPRLQVPLLSSILKNHVIKSPNLIGWFYWRFAAMSVKNRGNGHTRRLPANLIADIWHVRYRRFYTPIAAIGENRNRCTGHTWRFSPIAAIGV